MPENLVVTLTPGNFPQGYCYPANPQTFFTDLVALISAVIPGNFATFSFGPNRPGVDQQDMPWLRTDSSGFIDGWYTFSGDWVRPYPVPPSSQERRIWTDTEDALKIYDGGSTDSISDRTGPFWAVDHNFDFRVPLGAATGPAPNLTVVGVGDTGGSETGSFSDSSLPPHTHKLPFYCNDKVFQGVGERLPWDTSGGKFPLPASPLLPSIQRTDAAWSDSYELYTESAGSGSGTGTPFSLLNPYRGVFFIKRTARSLIVAP